MNPLYFEQYGDHVYFIYGGEGEDQLHFLSYGSVTAIVSYGQNTYGGHYKNWIFI